MVDGVAGTREMPGLEGWSRWVGDRLGKAGVAVNLTELKIIIR